MADHMGTGVGRLRALVVAASAIAAACSSPGADVTQQEEAVSADGILVCGSIESLRQPGAASAPAEWYSVIAMANKAKHYPDFAATTAQEPIRTCAAARAFYDRYVDYLELHPSFDADEVIEEDSLPVPPFPRGVDIDARGSHDTGPKILNGTGDQLRPVVGITNSQRRCTGTFIGRNWILTAGHCLATAPGFVVPPTGGVANEPNAKVHAWYPYTVSFAGPNGVVPGDVRTYNLVLQYADPRYTGFRDPTSLTTLQGGAHDAALLYVNDAYDNRLPNNDPALGTSTAGFMRLSLRDTITPSASAWGFGNPDPSALQRGGLQKYQLSVDPSGLDFFSATMVNGLSTDPAVCTGDSGGPLVDRYDIMNLATSTVETQFVETGILSRFNNGIPQSQCAQLDSTTYWPRASKEATFITKTVAKWYPDFPCVTGQTVGSPTRDFMQCWGTPCKDDSACIASETCVHPGSFLSDCTATCGTSSCDCMFGQCLPTQ